MIIENEGLYNGEFSFTTVNLDNLEEDIIHLKGFSTEQYTAPYFTFKDNIYYFYLMILWLNMILLIRNKQLTV